MFYNVFYRVRGEGPWNTIWGTEDEEQTRAGFMESWFGIGPGLGQPHLVEVDHREFYLGGYTQEDIGDMMFNVRSWKKIGAGGILGTDEGRRIVQITL